MRKLFINYLEKLRIWNMQAQPRSNCKDVLYKKLGETTYKDRNKHTKKENTSFTTVKNINYGTKGVWPSIILQFVYPFVPPPLHPIYYFSYYNKDARWLKQLFRFS